MTVRVQRTQAGGAPGFRPALLDLWESGLPPADPIPVPGSDQSQHTNGKVPPRRLANAERRPREYLEWLGHRNIPNTNRHTTLTSRRFKDLWQQEG